MGNIIDLSSAVPGVRFITATIRVVTVADGGLVLVVGGVDTTPNAALPGIVVVASIVPGGGSYSVLGSARLPSFGAGVTALSQRSSLFSNFILASTDEGVFK